MIYVFVGAIGLLVAFVLYVTISILVVRSCVARIRRNAATIEAIKNSVRQGQSKFVFALRDYDKRCSVADTVYGIEKGVVSSRALKMVNDQIDTYIKNNPAAFRNEAVYQHAVTYRRDYGAFAKLEENDRKLHERIDHYRKNSLLGAFAEAAADKLAKAEPKTESIFGFGLMRLPMLENGEVDIEQSMQMADCMIQNGFTYFDTAYFYLDGRSEEVAKRILCDRYRRDQFRLADKMPMNHLKAKEDVQRIFDEQLTRTGAEYFDYYLLHALNNNNYEKQAKDFEVFEFIAHQKQKGKVRQMGFSFHDKPEVLDKILTEHPEVDFVQLQINYYDWETNNVASRRCYEVARHHGKPIIVMEPIKGGTLANIPEHLTPSIADLLEKDTPATLALRFAAGREGVMMVLSGMSTIEQAKENVVRMQKIEPLSKEQTEQLLKVGKAMRKIPTHPCTRCRYCEQICPKKLPISEMIAAANRQLLGSREEIPQVDQCIGCGACESRCPQKLKIRKIFQKQSPTKK